MKRLVSIAVSVIVAVAAVLVLRDPIALETLRAKTTVVVSSILAASGLSSTPLSSNLFRSERSNMTTATDAAAAAAKAIPRAIRKSFLAVEQSEGAGARVRRSIGTPQLRNFSPFLMLDHFSVSPGAGFPDQYVFPPPLLSCLVVVGYRRGRHNPLSKEQARD